MIFADVVRVRLPAVERRARGQVRAQPHRQLLTMPPPKQKPTAPILPVQSGSRLAASSAEATKSSIIFGPLTLRNFTAPFSSSPGKPPTEVRPSGAKAMKLATREPAGDVLDIRIEAAVLVDHEHPGSLPLVFAGLAK